MEPICGNGFALKRATLLRFPFKRSTTLEKWVLCSAVVKLHAEYKNRNSVFIKRVHSEDVTSSSPWGIPEVTFSLRESPENCPK